MLSTLFSALAAMRDKQTHRKGSRSRKGTACSQGRRSSFRRQRHELESLEQRLLLSIDPLGGEFRINRSTGGDQANVSVDANAAGDYAVVWQGANVQGYGTNDIYLQRFNATGTPLGPEQRVNPDWHGEQTSPHVAVADNGTFVVTWASADDSGSGVYARRYAANGAPLADPVLVNTTTAGDQEDPEVEVNPATGDFAVVWTGWNVARSNAEVYGQRFDADGTRQGPELQINTYTDYEQSDPTLAVDVSGNFVVTWRSNNEDGYGWGVYARRFDADGNPLTGEIPVNTYTTYDQLSPAIGMDPATGKFTIAWQSLYQDGSGWGVYAQRFNADGTAVDAEFPANTFTSYDQNEPVFAVDAAGNFAIFWQSNNQDGSSWGVYGQRYAAGGTPSGAEFRANTYTSSDQVNAAAAYGAGDNLLVVWQSAYQDGSGTWGIYGQLYGTGLTQADLVPSRRVGSRGSEPGTNHQRQRRHPQPGRGRCGLVHVPLLPVDRSDDHRGRYAFGHTLHRKRAECLRDLLRQPAGASACRCADRRSVRRPAGRRQ